MKKLLAVALALVMVFGLVACSSTGKDGTTKISVFWYDESDVYLSSVRTALNKELDGLGVAYDNQYAANDQGLSSWIRSRPQLPAALTCW